MSNQARRHPFKKLIRRLKDPKTIKTAKAILEWLRLAKEVFDLFAGFGGF